MFVGRVEVLLMGFPPDGLGGQNPRYSLKNERCRLSDATLAQGLRFHV